MGENVSPLDAIEKAMEGVTPGPWEIYFGGCPTPTNVSSHTQHVASAETIEDSRYIAACNPVAMREVLALARKAEALQRENAELREALKPFADVVERAETAAEYFGACHVEEVDDSRPYGLTGTTWGDLRRARALLGGENAGN